jgi:hypothetical protein
MAREAWDPRELVWVVSYAKRVANGTLSQYRATKSLQEHALSHRSYQSIRNKLIRCVKELKAKV